MAQGALVWCEALHTGCPLDSCGPSSGCRGPLLHICPCPQNLRLKHFFFPSPQFLYDPIFSSWDRIIKEWFAPEATLGLLPGDL